MIDNYQGTDCMTSSCLHQLADLRDTVHQYLYGRLSKISIQVKSKHTLDATHLPPRYTGQKNTDLVITRIQTRTMRQPHI